MPVVCPEVTAGRGSYSFDLIGALFCYYCRQHIGESNIAVIESSTLLIDKKSNIHEIHFGRSYIDSVTKRLAEHHSQVKGILHDCLGSRSNRPLIMGKRYPHVQRARGTVFTSATKMCLFHLFRQTAIAAMF